MNAETVYEVAMALSETERERLRELLSNKPPKPPPKKQPKKKKQLWNDSELRERIIADFQKRAKGLQKKPP